MSLGRSPDQEDLYRSTRAACEARLPPQSIFRLLADAGHRLFPDEAFADLFAIIGRDSIPPRIVAVVMVLQRLHGMSDREAVGAFTFDLRWKYAFAIDTHAQTARCPAGIQIALRVTRDRSAVAEFGSHCATCPLRTQCTTSGSGRTLKIHPKHDTIVRSRARQRDPDWRARYRATRPKVERKIGHLMRRKHGGRRVRMRGRDKIERDLAVLAAAVNLARLTVLGVL